MITLMLMLLLQAPRPIAPREPVAAVEAVESAQEAAQAAAQRYRLRVTVEPTPVEFGGVVELVVQISRPREETLSLPADLAGSDELPRAPAPPRRDVQLEGDPSQSGWSRETVRIPFLALALDKLMTPALSLPIGKTTLTIAAQPVRVTPLALPEVVDAGPEGAEPTLDGHADVLLYAVEDWRPLVVATWVVAGALSWALLLWSLRRRRLRVGVVVMPPPPPRPAHELALQRLEALLQQGLLERGDSQPFVTQLMDDVLRGYVTDRFAMAAGSRTTRELVSELLGLSQTGDVVLDVPMVEGLLSDADVVKFAQGTVTTTRATEMANRVRGFITATIPTIPTPPKAPS